MKPRTIWEFFKRTYTEWNDDNAPRLGAALAYYTVFSVAPLLIIAIGIAGLVFGEEAARGAIVEQIQGLVGPNGALAIESMVAQASKPTAGILATLIGIGTLLFGASGVFAELQAAMNVVWDRTQNPEGGFWALIKARFLSVLMVLGMGFLLLVSLVLSAAIAAMGKFLGGVLPLPEFVMQLLNFAISFAVITVLFAMIYKILPDADVEWRDVWVGAAFTSFLFTVGKLLIGLYIGKANFSSSFGAAGSLVVILVWVYYSAQILLFGAEFTKVYATTHGSMKDKPQPKAPPAVDPSVQAPTSVPRPQPIAARERTNPRRGVRVIATAYAAVVAVKSAMSALKSQHG